MNPRDHTRLVPLRLVEPPAHLPGVEFRNVSKFIGHGKKARLVLSNVNATFSRGKFIAVLGQKGSGKTTLANLLNGNTRPDQGEISHGATVSWPTGARRILNNTTSLRANIRFLAGVYGFPIEDLIEDVRTFASIGAQDFDRPIRDLPNEIGNRATTALSLAAPFDILVTDDTMFLGSNAFRKKAMDRLASMKGTRGVIGITRNIALVRELFEDCMTLSDGRLITHANRGDAIRAFKAQDRQPDQDQNDDDDS